MLTTYPIINRFCLGNAHVQIISDQQHHRTPVYPEQNREQSPQRSVYHIVIGEVREIHIQHPQQDHEQNSTGRVTR